MDFRDKSRIRAKKYREMKKFKRDYLNQIVHSDKSNAVNLTDSTNSESDNFDCFEENVCTEENCFTLNSNNIDDTDDSENRRELSTDSDGSSNDSEENEQANSNSCDSDDDQPDIVANNNILNEVEEISKLRLWAIECRTPLIHLEKLLKILQSRLLPTLPKSAATFLNSNDSAYTINKMEDCDNTIGEYLYFGIEQGLQLCVNTEIHPDTLELQVNIDGMKLFKSSIKTMWPILVKVHHEPDIYKPFVVSAYVGNSKPKSVNLFLKDFIAEINNLQNRGTIINNKQFHVTIKCFICDTPARAYIKCIKGHNSQHGCERCLVERKSYNRIATYLEVNSQKRSDNSFRNFYDIQHHIDASPLMLIEPSIDMVNDFILDSMHLCYLGVMKRLVDAWMSSDLNVRLSSEQKNILSSRLDKIRLQQPEEFHRKIRSIEHHAKFKATDYRFILLFCGPIVLKDILDNDRYKHFMLLHVACRMLSLGNAPEYTDYAQTLLIKFVLLAEALYGPQFVVINVHNLIHLSDDVKHMQCGLSTVTAFPFETYLGQLSNIIRSPHNVLAQLARRLHECNLHVIQTPSLPSIHILKGSEEDIRKLRYKTVIIATKPPNNMILLENNKVCEVTKISKENNVILLKTRIWKIKNELYSYPCNSSDLNTYELQLQPSEDEQIISVKKIKFKVMKLSMFDEINTERIFAVSLLH